MSAFASSSGLYLGPIYLLGLVVSLEAWRRVNEVTARERAEQHECGPFHAGNHPQDAALLRIGHLCLEADHVVQAAGVVVLA